MYRNFLGLAVLLIIGALLAISPERAYAESFQSQANNQCLSREQVLRSGDLFGEFELQGIPGIFESEASGKRAHIITGDRASRKFIAFSDFGTNPNEVCFRRHFSGFGWAGVSSDSSRKKPNLRAHKPAPHGGFACSGVLTGRCFDYKNLRSSVLDGKGRLLAYGLVNAYYSKGIGDGLFERNIIQYFRNREAELEIILSPQDGGAGVKYALGTVVQSLKVAGTADVFDQWRQYTPPVPKASLSDSIWPAPNTAPRCSAIPGRMVLALQADHGAASNNMAMRIYHDEAGRWAMTTASKFLPCEHLVFVGDQFEVSDPYLDQFSPTAKIAFPRFDTQKTRVACKRLEQNIRNANERDARCFPLSDFASHFRGVGQGIAMRGTTVDPTGKSIWISVFAKPGNKNEFTIIQTARDGTSLPFTSGSNFRFSRSLADTVFVERRAAVDAHNARIAAQRRIDQAARAEAERLAIKEAEERRLEAKRKEAERLANLTPEQRAEYQLLSTVDRIILQDSKFWTFNKYFPGTTRNLKFWNWRNGQGSSLTANYDYKSPLNPRTLEGQIEIRMVNDGIQCIKYLDSGCRGIRSGPDVNTALIAGFLASVLILSRD